MTVKEFIGPLESSDRLRIIEDGAEVYVGYLAALKPFADHEISEEYRKYSGHEVKKFRAVPEITHRRWKELGLMKPLEPDQTAQYKFKDTGDVYTVSRERAAVLKEAGVVEVAE